MTEIHAIGGLVVLGGVSLLAAVAVAAVILDRGFAWVGRLGAVLVIAVGVEVALGAATWLTGRRPGEGLHVLYGIAVLAAFPLASSFAADAPPRERTGVVAVAAVVSLLLIWRLYATG